MQRFRGRQPHWGLVLKLASIFLGAGVWIVPAEAGTIGLVPLVVVLVVVTLVAIWFYQRFVAASVGDDAGGDGGLSGALRHLGARGEALSLLVLACYVLPAEVVYCGLAITALKSVAGSGESATWIAGISFVLLLVAGLTYFRTEPVQQRLSLLGAVWSLGIAVMGVSHDFTSGDAALLPVLKDVVGAICFGLGTAVTVGLERWPGRTVPAAEPAGVSKPVTGPDTSEPRTTDVSAGAGLKIQICMMLAMLGLIAIATRVKLRTSGLWFPTDGLHHLSPPAVFNAVSVVLFLHVAVCSSMSSYPEMKKDHERKRVVTWSLFVVLVVLLGWCVIDLFYGHSMLAALEDGDLNSVTALPELTSRGALRVVITIVSGAALLIAVNSAAVGFAEGLVAEFDACQILASRLRLKVHRDTPGGLSLAVWTIVVMIVCQGASAILITYSDSCMSLVHVIPESASATIIFALPLLVKTDGRRKRVVFAILAAAVSLAGAGVAGYLSFHQKHLHGVPVHVAALVFAAVPALVTLAAARHLVRAVAAAAKDSDHEMPTDVGPLWGEAA